MQSGRVKKRSNKKNLTVRFLLCGQWSWLYTFVHLITYYNKLFFHLSTWSSAKYIVCEWNNDYGCNYCMATLTLAKPP